MIITQLSDLNKRVFYLEDRVSKLERALLALEAALNELMEKSDERDKNNN